MARSTFSFRSSSSRKNQRGQGMSEYLIIVALIAIAAIGVVGGFGDVVQGQVSQMAQELAGSDADDALVTTGETNATGAASEKNLSNYAADNGQ